MTEPLLDALAKRAGFALTRAEARRRMVCVRCEAAVSPSWEVIDLEEWRITALCPSCFDLLAPEPDE